MQLKLCLQCQLHLAARLRIFNHQTNISNMHDFRVGDTVCLITNPDDTMKVCSVFGQRLVECSWIGKEGRLYRHSFRPESLRLVTTDDPVTPHHEHSFLRINTDEEDEFTL